MDQERTTRVEEIFELVADLPEPERERALANACGDDTSLAEQVRALIEADRQAPGVLPAGGAELAASLLDGASALPRQFGKYVIRRYLDEGGMGSVFLAERTDVGGEVAVKFLQHSWTSPARRLRFASEGRTLAALNHRHIARLYDAGVTAGTPWLAMEYVEGPPIGEFCAVSRAGLGTRLRLFRDVCAAVSYAHRKLVVHLDLKPSNILVDAAGDVKLVDFGIARPLSGEGGVAERTEAGARLLSINYASPEQIRGEPVDVQTDVHALGAVLYELLTGAPPADLRSVTTAELVRLIQEPPPPPSARAHRANAIHALRAEWRDLDAICLTALNRDKQARYPTVDALRRDVDHFLANRPLDARTDALRAYRLRKFLVRHRRAVTATAAGIVFVAALSTFFTTRLIDARDRAVASEARTARIHSLMLNLFEGDDQAAGPAGELRVVSLFDRGVREADHLQDEPEMQADLRRTFGELYHKLGQFERAAPLLAAAREGSRAVFGADDPRTLRVQMALADLKIDRSEHEEAKALARDALAVATRRRPPDLREIAAANAVLGKALTAEGDYGTAMPLLESAARDLGESPGLELSEALGNLANVQYYLGLTEASEETNRRALALDRQLYGDRHPHVAVGLYNLGNIHLDRGDYAGGEALYREATQITDAWYGPVHPRSASNVLMLGRSLAYQGRIGEASELYERAATATRATYGEEHLRYGGVLSLQGDLARDGGDLNRADALFRRAAGVFERTVGRSHEFYLHQLSNLGSVAIARRAFAEAEKLLRPAFEGLSEAVPDQRYTPIAQMRLGLALAGQGRTGEALPLLRAAAETLERITGAATAETKAARQALAETERLAESRQASGSRRTP